MSALTWRRVDAVAHPCAYFNDSHGFAIFPGPDHGWELCRIIDGGYDYKGWHRTVAHAKAEADYQATREAQA